VLSAAQVLSRHDPKYADLLGQVLQVIDPGNAETMLRAYLDDAIARGDHRGAAVVAGYLISSCLDGGRLAEALALAERKVTLTRRAGLGPWTQFSDQVRRLQILNLAGRAQQVLDDTPRLRDHMRALPAIPGPDEDVSPWEVREVLLGAGRDAARLLGRHEDALAFNAEVIASLRARQAPASETAQAAFNDYYPLLRRGRVNDALRLLLDCRQAFDDARDIRALGATFAALADVEDTRGRGDAAIRFARDALRYAYLAEDIFGIITKYHNLGNYLHDYTRQFAPALDSHLTAALISVLAGINASVDPVGEASADLRASSYAATPPPDVPGLCRRIGDIPGTDPAGLIAKLCPNPETAERALQDLITQAREMAARTSP
jgi:hypothetical protein